jgi:hypothetical protein
MSKKVEDLRDALMSVIEGVRDGSIKPEQARVISELSQVVVNSAKVEVELYKATQGKARGTGFMGDVVQALPAPAAATAGGGGSEGLPSGILGVTTHRISDTEPGGA